MKKALLIYGLLVSAVYVQAHSDLVFDGTLEWETNETDATASVHVPGMTADSLVIVQVDIATAAYPGFAREFWLTLPLDMEGVALFAATMYYEERQQGLVTIFFGGEEATQDDIADLEDLPIRVFLLH